MLRSLAMTILWLVVGVASVHAGCPDPASSRVPPRLITCPAGDSVFTVIALRIGIPVTKEITVDFSGCPGFRLDPLGDPSYTIDSTGLRISKISTQYGVADFHIRGGGGCYGGTVRILGCDAILLGERTVTSPDQNGDLVVNGADVALAQTKIGTTDASADFDGDGTVTAHDVDVVAAHLGHHASGVASVGPTPVAGIGLAVSPNPASRRVTISFSLSADGPTSIELLDLAGRRLRYDALGSLRAGGHAHAMRFSEALAPGVYLVRVAQGSRRRVGKLCVID